MKKRISFIPSVYNELDKYSVKKNGSFFCVATDVQFCKKVLTLLYLNKEISRNTYEYCSSCIIRMEKAKMTIENEHKVKMTIENERFDIYFAFDWRNITSTQDNFIRAFNKVVSRASKINTID